MTACLLCARSLEATEVRTCLRCLSLTRRRLRDLPGLVALGEALLAAPSGPSWDDGRGGGDELPGGDLLVMLGPGAPSGSGHPADPLPVVVTLATWVRDWAETRGEGPLPSPSVADLCGWLSARAGWAAAQHDAFDEFDGDLARMVVALEDATGAGDRLETGAPCLDCRALLVRDWHPRTGRADSWACPRCRRRYDAAQYVLAVRDQLEQARVAG